MANNLPMIRKAFLTTRNISSGVFLLTERFNNGSNETLFYLIEAENEKSAKNLQRYLQSDLVKNFMASPSFSILNFESSLHFVNKRIQSNNDNTPNRKISSLVGLVEGNTLHLSMTGEIEGYLLRKGKINSLTEGLDSDGELGFFNITSGDLSIGDLVIIGNKKIFNRLSLDRIRRTLTQFTPKEAIRDFYQILRRSKDYDCNAVILQASPPQPNDKEEAELPDLLYLDEIIESRLTKIYKRSKPIIQQLYSDASKYFNLASIKTRELATRSSSRIKENYAPKTKELLSQTNSRAIEGFSKLSTSMKNKNSLKVKPYSRRMSSEEPKWLRVASNLFRSLVDKKYRKLIYVSLIIVLVMASYLKIKANNENREAIKRQHDATFSYDKAVETYNQAKEDIGLGRSDGMDRLSGALALSITAKESNATREKAIALHREIQASIDSINKTIRILDPKPIFSFKYDIVESVVSGSVIYGITADGKVYSTDARDKAPKLIAAISEDLGKPISAAYSDSMNMIIVLTDTNKIWGLDEQTQSGSELQLDTGGSWETANAIGTYSTYVYLLDGASGKIWRHSKSGDKFTSGKAYAGSKNADAKDGISLAIDGAIFVLKNGGVVNKFSQGIPDPSLVIQNPPKPDEGLTQASQIYTDADSQYIFISDASKNRVIRYAKDGQYNNQYILDGITISQVLHNPRLQKLWLISGKDVYELDL